MTKSKTPITDKYVEGYNAALAGLGCSFNRNEITYLSKLELEAQLSKEETPTKAIEVLTSLEKMIQDRLKAHEVSILAAEKARLELEYQTKIRTEIDKLEIAKKGIQEECDKKVNLYKHESINNRKLWDKTREELKALQDEVMKEDKETLILYINKLKSSYKYTNKTRNIGKGMLSKKVMVNHTTVLEIFQEMLKEIGINLEVL